MDLTNGAFTGDTVVQAILGSGHESDNPVRMQVDDSIGQLTRLTSLSIVDCPIGEVSSSISRLQNLKDLDLDCSFITVVRRFSNFAL